MTAMAVCIHTTSTARCSRNGRQGGRIVLPTFEPFADAGRSHTSDEGRTNFSQMNTIDQSKLDRIKASLASEAKAEGVSEGPWKTWETASIDYRPCQVGSEDSAVAILLGGGPKKAIDKPTERRNAAFISRARTTAPVMAKLLLDEILWLEQTWNSHCYNRLARLVNGWPEETL